MILKPILSQFGKALAAAGLCHLALLCLSLWLYPITTVVDTAHFRTSPFPNLFRAAVHGTLENGLDVGDQVVIIGPSNARGFRPDELASRMPGVRIHNLSTPSMRVDEIGHLLRLAWDVMPENQRPRTTFVATLIFASFPHPQSLYGRREAGIASELARTGLFSEVRGEFVPKWGRQTLPIAAILQRPLALVDTVGDALSRHAAGIRKFAIRASKKGTLDLALLYEGAPEDKFLFPKADSEDGKRTNLAFFQAYLGSKATTLGPAQFEELGRICEWATKVDADLVLIGMPVPDWVQDELPFYAEYQRRLVPIRRQVSKSPQVRFVDLHDADLPLWDSTHPHPDHTGQWANTLAAAISKRDSR